MRLAERGVTFANSFVNFPLCCPSRATLLTGQYAHNHGTLGNIAPEGGFAKFTAEHGATPCRRGCRRDGYTRMIGKYLNGYGGDGGETFVPPGWTRVVRGGRAVQRVYDYALNENGALVRYGDAAEDFKQDVITRRAVEVISRRAPARQPFFLFVNYTAPHSGGPNPSPNPPSECDGTAKPAPRHADAFDSEPLPQPPSFDEAGRLGQAAGHPEPGSDHSRRSATRSRGRYRCRLGSLLSVDEGVGRIVGALRAHASSATR